MLPRVIFRGIPKGLTVLSVALSGDRKIEFQKIWPVVVVVVVVVVDRISQDEKGNSHLCRPRLLLLPNRFYRISSFF